MSFGYAHFAGSTVFDTANRVSCGLADMLDTGERTVADRAKLTHALAPGCRTESGKATCRTDVESGHGFARAHPLTSAGTMNLGPICLQDSHQADEGDDT